MLVKMLAARLGEAVVARTIGAGLASYAAVQGYCRKAPERALRAVLLGCDRMARVMAYLIHCGILPDELGIVLESSGCKLLALVGDTVVVAATPDLVGTAARGSILVELDSSAE